MIAGATLAAVLAVASVAGGPVGGDEPTVELPFETILDEASSGLHERRREVIRDAAGWARLWDEIHEGVTPAPPLPAVDFSRHMLIAAALGSRPSGGFDVKIRSVATRGEKLEVGVFESCPPTGSRVSLALTQPVEVVRVERVAQAPAFRETRAPSCK